MPIEVKLPKLGDGIESGDVLEIFVREGDVIKANQDLLELETDKATVSVPSSHAGKVLSIAVKPGQTVPIGALLVTLEGSAAAASEAPKAAPAKPAASPPAAKPAPTAQAPVKPAPEKSAPKPAAEAPKPAPRPAPSPATKPAPAAPVARSAPEPEVPENGGNGGTVAAGPAIRRFAREVGVDLHRVAGSGESGRITRDDVLEVVRQGHRGVPEAPKSSAAPTARRTTPMPVAVTPPGEPGSDNWGPIRIEKMAKIRKTIAAKMHESWTTIPKVTNFDDADITELERIRQDTKEDYAAAGIRLSSMPFVIKACALALKNHPAVNASLDMENERTIYKEYVNIGIAVDSDRGLVVPALRDADRLSIPEIARTLADLADRVRSNNYSIDDLRGGTFTISNLGAIGGTYSTPIINSPEVAILLTGRARKMPVVIDDKVEIRLMMPLSLSYDHRIIDGATAARFLNDVIGYLKAPSRLLLAP